jgi:hypothetical protein
VPNVTAAAVGEVAALLAGKARLCSEYLLACKDDYSLLLRLRNAPQAILIEKQNGKLDVRAVADKVTSAIDIVYTTRLSYVKWALTHPYGHEILFVGSGGIFEYRSRTKASANLHREFMSLLRAGNAPVHLRRASQSPLLAGAKRAVKHLFGRSSPDLYDLRQWTVFEATEAKESMPLARVL